MLRHGTASGDSKVNRRWIYKNHFESEGGMNPKLGFEEEIGDPISLFLFPSHPALWSACWPLWGLSLRLRRPLCPCPQASSADPSFIFCLFFPGIVTSLDFGTKVRRLPSVLPHVGLCVCQSLWRAHLFATPCKACSPPGSSVHGIPQARILQWVACPPPGGLPDPGLEPRSLALAGGFFPI